MNMKMNGTAKYFLVGLAVSLIFQLLSGSLIPAAAQSSSSTPSCLSAQPHATSGGSEKLVYRFEGVSTDYWLYYSYGAQDTEQQYAMELIITTTDDSCDVAFWNAPGHSFAYSKVVPMDVAKQFSLAGFQQHLEAVGQAEFEDYYESADPSTFFEEDRWALRQLGVNIR
jgi:hypothetical protein